MGGGVSRKYRKGLPDDDPEAIEKDEAFSAEKDHVLQWEGINLPARTGALPLLLEFDRAHRCDHWLWRPLHYAALYGVVSAVDSLVKAGAVVDSRTGGHALVERRLTRATFNFACEVECLFRKTWVRVTVEELNGGTVRVRATDTNDLHLMHIEDLRCVGHTAMQHPHHIRHFSYATPLHIAVHYQHVDVVGALLANKANPNTDWNDGREKPLHTAITLCHYETVRVLLEHNSDPNAEDCWGRTPLSTAAVSPSKPPGLLAVLLLEAGSDRAATDKSGRTAAQLARHWNYGEFAVSVETYEIGTWKQQETAFMPNGSGGGFGHLNVDADPDPEQIAFQPAMRSPLGDAGAHQQSFPGLVAGAGSPVAADALAKATLAGAPPHSPAYLLDPVTGQRLPKEAGAAAKGFDPEAEAGGISAQAPQQGEFAGLNVP